MATGNNDIGRPILEELSEEIQRRGLEHWEAPDLVAQPLVLLYRCLDDSPDTAGEKRKLYAKICRLDAFAGARIEVTVAKKLNQHVLQPSLIDRLIDREPGNRKEAQDARNQSLQRIEGFCAAGPGVAAQFPPLPDGPAGLRQGTVALGLLLWAAGYDRGVDRAGRAIATSWRAWWRRW